MMSTTRRGALVLGGAVIGGAVLGMPRTAAAKNDAEDLIKAFTGGASVAKGKVKLDLPDIAENGNTVPLAFTVDSPMTADAHVVAVLVVAEGNPRGGVATFHFTSDTGVAEASTRIRLAQTQNVVAVAKMNDGSFFSDTRQVKVTIGGCGG
ncbi:thiosulfate oxidation carrier protein SoxY [Blastochloris sulfoviridis]|uniref:Thiosulfate oxidation carrier protein SoxY n=1 Tax=Blastochloris sulfoviridis TaxID=50712 RepID=A0A5M6HKE7_9HYPH|nr:thiosulfate oxidation carrier protein SoxY [Blastochloris sulfoviridis]KAA5596255.1 thiosulfate oxidation carrier protein SoxY [Blastochloris sulfoviridis]